MRHRKLHGSGVLILGLSLLLTACPGDGDEPCVPASVQVTPSEATLDVGETTQFNASSRDATGVACGSVNWTSGSAAVATCSSTGLVTAVSPGSATIRASASGVSGSAAVTVRVPCSFTCQCDMSTCSWIISCESGSTSTQYVNETTSYEYDDFGRRVKTTKAVSRVVTYLNTGHAYTITGTVVWDLSLNRVDWNLQVTGGAFGDTTRTCTGSQSF